MDPEQRLFIIQEYFTVKSLIFLVRALIGMLHPERMRIAERNRAFIDLNAVSCRGNLHRLLLSLVVFSFFCFGILMDMLYNNIVIPEIGFVYRLIFLLCVFSGKINIHRHKGTVLLDHFTHPVFIAEFQALIIQEQSDLRTDCSFISVLDIIFCTAVAAPVHRNSSLFIGKRVNMHLICNHKCRIKSKAEVTDHLIVCSFVLIFLQKLCCTGKSNLSNIFFYFVCRHTDTVINKFQSFCLGIDDNLNCRLIIIGECIFSHNFQFLQFRNGIAPVGNHLTDKNIMV